jgi:hypothetical protein
MKKIDSERKAAERSRGVLALLSPTAAYADHIVHPLRLAAGVAANAASQDTSGRKALNKKRGHATVVLDAVIRALQTRTLTHKIITSAQEAIDDWLAALNEV